MRYKFITKNGEVKEATNIKKLTGYTWGEINVLNLKWKFYKEEGDFLRKYHLKPTTFNIACLQNLNLVFLNESEFKNLNGLKNRKI